MRNRFLSHSVLSPALANTTTNSPKNINKLIGTKSMVQTNNQRKYGPDSLIQRVNMTFLTQNKMKMSLIGREISHRSSNVSPTISPKRAIPCQTDFDNNSPIREMNQKFKFRRIKQSRQKCDDVADEFNYLIDEDFDKISIKS